MRESLVCTPQNFHLTFRDCCCGISAQTVLSLKFIPYSLQRPPEGLSTYLVLSTLTQKFFFFSSWKSKHLLFLYFQTLSSGPLRLHAAGNRSTTFLCYTQVLNFKICLQFLLSAFRHYNQFGGQSCSSHDRKNKKNQLLLICLPFLFLISAPFPP